MYLPNGNPGYFAEGLEYEIERVTNDLLELEVVHWIDKNYETIADRAFNQLIKGDPP